MERALERQLPAVLAKWAPPRWESDAQPSPMTGGSKLHLVLQFLPSWMTSSHVAPTHSILLRYITGVSEAHSW